MITVDWSEWVEYWPDEDEEGFDGEHYGGIKGLKDGAPSEVVEAYNEYMRAISEGYRL